jgi:hypothetical protein
MIGLDALKNPPRAALLFNHPVTLEPISKLPEQDDKAGELDETEEVLGMILPTDEDATLPLYPSEEALDQPAPQVSAQAPSILRGRLAAV